MTTTTESKPFSEAWKAAEPIKGWLSQAEGALLYNAATSIKEHAAIVEIGSYRGKSTALLAESGRFVAAFDPLEPGTGGEDNYQITEDDATALYLVAEKYKNCEWYRQRASDVVVSRVAHDIGLLYIDGNHQEPYPLNDFRTFQPHLKPGTLVAFHDYGAAYGVGCAVAQLEREGVLERQQLAGLMYLGRVTERPLPTKRVFLGLPYNGGLEPETWDSALDALRSDRTTHVYAWRSRWSLLERSFNDCLERCLKRGDCDYWVLLHSDIGLSNGWLPKMIAEMESHDLDALHVVTAIKNSEGHTSTAVAYSDDEWGLVRRITTKELQQLPVTFDINTLRERYDKDAKILLPNTGCLLFRVGDWLKDFPGFSGQDRIRRINGSDWQAEVVPEDWNFGFWAARNGVRVGGTRAVVSKHFGRQAFPNNDGWGYDVDPNWERQRIQTG